MEWKHVVVGVSILAAVSCSSPCTEIGCGPEPDPYCQNVIEVRPNGPGCDPVCKVCNDTEVKPTIPPSRDNLACPPYPLYFNIPLSQPACTADSDCRSGEKCCFWGAGKQCKTGLVMTAKAGVCPVPAPKGSSHTCKMDYVGCSYDSQCEGDEKCCRADGCSYKECRAPTLALAVEQIPTQPPKICTLKGCAAPPAALNCTNVEIVYPNGEGCEPTCRVCKVPKPPKVCTKRGCPPPLSSDCKKTKKYRPNGKGCGPVCEVCVDKPKLDCPSYPFYFDVELTQPECVSDKECKTGEKCCDWGSGKQCVKGVDTTRKPGVCPATKVADFVSSDCIADAPGCDFDSQCPGTEKCCLNSVCKYKECKPAVTENCRWITKKRCHPTARKPNGKRKCRRIRKYVCQ